MRASLNALRLLAEVLLIIALAEGGVMIILPVIAPNATTLNGALLDVGLLLMLAAPAVYWRLNTSMQRASQAFAFRQELARVGRPVMWLVAITQVMGLLITAASVWWESQGLDGIAKGRFDQGADRTQTEVLRRLNQSLSGLKGARGAMAANPSFKRLEFRAYVQSRDLPVEFPGIRGFGLIERVQRTDLDNYVAGMRRDGAPHYQVHSTGEAPDLYLVKYVEPLAQNAVALGFDLGQDAARRAAITYAVDTAQPTLLVGIELLQDAKKSPGLLFFLPVYRNGTDPKNVTERRRDLRGILYAPVVASELLGSVAAVTDNLIDFELFDASEPNADKLIFDADGILSVASKDKKTAPKRKYATERRFELGGKVLTLRVSSSARFEAVQDRSSLIIIGAGGTLISLLIAVSVGLLASGRHRAQALATAMTAELDRMAQVVQHTANAVTIMDRDMRIAWVNQGFIQITGYSFDEAHGKTPSELLTSGKSDPAAIAALIDGANRGAPCRVELINRAKGGREYWADTEVQPMRDKQGGLIGFMEIGTDVTAQKQIQRQLEAAMRESRALLDTVEVHAIVSITDASGVITEVNDAFTAISRYRRDELIGRNHSIIHSGVHSTAFWQEFWGTISNGKPWRGEICNRAKDGTLYWVDSMIAPFAGSDGVIEKYISIRTDISARKQAEKALSLSNALMEASQSVAKVGGWELNLLTGDLYWTRETYRIHETTPQEFNPTVDAGVSYFLPDSRERIRLALEKAIATGEGYDLELETLTTKGRRIDVRTTCTATLEDARVIRISGIFQDITERKQYERSLQEARDKAEIASRSKAQFLANMSHEIRTPMNAILGMLNLLQTTDLSHRQLDYVDKTDGAAKSLLGLINDILDFSKVEAGKMTLDLQPMSIEKMMRNLSVILSGNLNAKAVQILFDIDPEIPAMVLGDAMRLQQVLINLGGNAVKFTPQGEVVVSVRRLALQEGVAALQFSVRDSGIGIAPENQAHIFTGFSQAEASTTRKFGGTGLGLAISQRFVELMGGKLALQSALGQGSVFSFQLAMTVVGGGESEVSQVPDAPPAPVSVKNVLLVDANPLARSLAQAAIQSWGWRVECAGTGEDAIAWVDAPLAKQRQDAVPFDVIFMDWHMSGMDGWQTIARLRQQYAQANWAQPCIVMVAANRRDGLDQRTAEEHRLINGFLVKPVTPKMMREAALHDANWNTGGVTPCETARNQRRLTGMQVLVVEDNLLNQQVAEELLSAEGATVRLAANGQLGVEAIKAAAGERQFDAVLMDIQMPVMDGFAATSVVRRTLNLKDLPIIAMTANAMASDRDDCLAAGMNEHIGKPFDLDRLVQTLLRVSGFKPAGDSALDVAGALTRMGGLTMVYVRAARGFLQTLPAQVEELASQAATDAPAAVALAHTLKGIAATLGAHALAHAAARIEVIGKSNSTSVEREPAIAQLRQAAQAAAIALEAAVDALAPATPPALAAVI